MAKDKKNLEWMDVDIDSVKGPTKTAYDAYKAAQKIASEKRGEFETAFLAEARKKKAVDEGQTLRFSYNFGKVGVAKDQADAPKTKGGTFKL